MLILVTIHGGKCLCVMKILCLASNCSLCCTEAVDILLYMLCMVSNVCSAEYSIHLHTANVSCYTVCLFITCPQSHMASPKLLVCAPVTRVFHVCFLLSLSNSSAGAVRARNEGEDEAEEAEN